MPAWKWTGRVAVYVGDAAPDRSPLVVVDNVACVNGKGAIASYIAGLGVPGITYLALGNGVTTVNAVDTKLNAEGYRQAITSTSLSGNALTFTTAIGNSSANGSWTEVGLFGSTGATSSANTGVLFAHANFLPFASFNKIAGTTWTIIWTVTLT